MLGQWPCRHLPRLLGQDEVNGAGSGLGSVMASPNSECALLSLFFLCEDSELPCSQALVPGPFLLPLRGCYAHPHSPAHTSGRYQGNPGYWVGPLDLEPSIAVSCVSLSPIISLPPAAMAKPSGLRQRQIPHKIGPKSIWETKEWYSFIYAWFFLISSFCSGIP